MSGYEQQFEESLRDLHRQQEMAADFQRRMASLTSTKVSRRRVVSVTVGGAGEVRRVEFPTTAYQALSGAELAKTVLETIGEARDAVLAEAAVLLAPMLPPGLDAAMLVRGKADLSAIMPEDPDDSVVVFGPEVGARPGSGA